jgi:hypothetical protein
VLTDLFLSEWRQTCILFLTCWGGRPKYFLQLSEDFRRQYRIVPYLYNNGAFLPKMYESLEKEWDDCALLIYQAYDTVPILKATREHASLYDEFLQRIPSHVTKVSAPIPYFPPLWPFHCADPRNANPDRPCSDRGTHLAKHSWPFSTMPVSWRSVA